MSDPGSIAAAYGIVLGGLALYVVSIARRLQAARRTAQAVERERALDARDLTAAGLPPGNGPSETPR